MPEFTMSNPEVNTQGRVIGCSVTYTKEVTVSENATQRCARCGAPTKSKYCGTACFRAWQRSGNIETRFWSKIKAGAPNACWPWQASLIGVHGYKYGQFSLPRGADGKPRTTYAHRFAYELTHGAIPQGLVVLHSCDRPSCCNPAHLSVGTQGDNLRDASAKGHFKVPRPTAHKINTTDLVEIDRLLATGGRGTQARIAKQYGVSKAWVSQYAKGDRRLYDRPKAKPAKTEAA